MSKTARNSLKLSVLTMGSRMLGLLRDHYQAVFFGTGAVATAWEIAYMLPNMLRNLLAEGVLSQAFIPIYSESLKETEEEAKRVAGLIISFLFFFLLIIVGLGIMSFPYILPIYTGKTPEEAGMLIGLSQILFMYIFTVSLTAIFAGISNTHLYFSVPALSPIILNLVMISGFVTLGQLNLGIEGNVRLLAMVVVGGGVMQLLVQMAYVRYKGWWPSFNMRLRDPALKKIFVLMAPAVLGAGLFQLNQLMDIAIASYMIDESKGAVPALRFAHRLMQLPTGIIGVALSTAILPTLAQGIRKQKEQSENEIKQENEPSENAHELVSALSFSLFLTVPAALGLFFLGQDIINLLFFGGEWTEISTNSTWIALRFYCLGVPLYSINKILTSSFFAYQDTRTPVRVMLMVVAVNLPMNLLLVPILDQGGLALSTAICACITGMGLMRYLTKRMGPVPFGDLFHSALRLTPLWLAMACLLLALRYGLAPYEQGLIETFFSQIDVPRARALLHVVPGILGSMALYFLLAYYLRVEQIATIRKMFKR